MSNIEKIKAEIARLENMDYPCDTSEQATGFYNALDRLSYFIDSLPEDNPLDDPRFGDGFEAGRAVQRIFDGTDEDSMPEETCKDSLQVQETCKENTDSFTDKPKKMSVGEAMKYINEKIAKTRASKSWEGVDVDKFLDEIRGRELDDFKDFDSMPEEIPPYVTGFKGDPSPAGTSDLEEELDNYFEGLWPGIETAEQCNTDLHFTPPAIMRLARHFAEWQKKQDKDWLNCELMKAHLNGVKTGDMIARKEMMRDKEDRNDDNLPRYYGD